MSENSIWRTWKPYVLIVVLVAGAFWWYSSQASFARLKDGAYDCQAVFVNASGKYEVLVDADGNPYPAISATVRGGALVDMSEDSALTSGQLASLTVRKHGTSHFHVTDDPALRSYNAAACDYAGSSPATGAPDSMDSAAQAAGSKSCASLFKVALSQERKRDTAGAINAKLDSLGDRCPGKHQILVDYVSIKGVAEAGTVGTCAEYAEYEVEAESIELARHDGYCSGSSRRIAPEAAAEWTCNYAPTMNDDWHDDVICSNGIDQQRPYLREWDSFITEAEIMESAREYEEQLNG